MANLFGDEEVVEGEAEAEPAEPTMAPVSADRIVWYKVEADSKVRKRIDPELYSTANSKRRSTLKLSHDQAKNIRRLECEGTFTAEDETEDEATEEQAALLDRKQSQRWRIDPHFAVEKLQKSMYVVEGEDLVLSCELKMKGASPEDDPLTLGDLVFEWFQYEPTVLDVEDGFQTVEGVFRGNSTTEIRSANDADLVDPHLRIVVAANKSELKIENAIGSDRAVFRCLAKLTSFPGTVHPFKLVSSTYTFVRIKDKYALLYPLVGIVVELVALAAIIFCCERSKGGNDGDANSVGDDEDDLAYKGSKNGSSSGKIRHRRA